jgi:DNA polymerase I
MMKRLFLVDISSLFFRAFYAIRPLTSPSGLPTNAVYGVLSMLTKLLKEENPDYIAICYDRKEPSFRKTLYEDYKANRSEMPDELGPQIPVIKKLIELLGLPSLEVPDFEADDIIGTLAIAARKKDIEVFIVSGDKDFSQLIVDHMYLYKANSRKMGSRT